MLTRDQYVELMEQECRVAMHLYTRIPPGGLDYRPTPEQRSTLELLRYLSICGHASLQCMLDGMWDHYREYAAPSEGMKAEEFPAAMETQIRKIREAMGKLTEDEIRQRETKYVTQETIPLGAGLLKSYAWLVAYRMQLFLYAKQAGAPELNTLNAWLGRDPTPSS